MHIKTEEKCKDLVLRCINESGDYPTKREILTYVMMYDYERKEVETMIDSLLGNNTIFKDGEDRYLTIDESSYKLRF